VQAARLTGRTFFGEPRCVPRRCFERGVPSTAATAAGDENLLSALRQIGQYLSGLCICDDSASRQVYIEIAAIGALHVATVPVPAICGCKVAFAAKGHQGVQMIADAQVDVATASAMAAVRPAKGHVFFPAKAEGAVAAVASLDFYGGLIKEHA